MPKYKREELIIEKERLEQQLVKVEDQIAKLESNTGKIRIECEYCHGTGKVIDTPPDPQLIPLMKSCEMCGGYGYIYMKPYWNEIVYFQK